MRVEEVRNDGEDVVVICTHGDLRFAIKGQIIPSDEEITIGALVELATIKWGSNVGNEVKGYLERLCSRRGTEALAKWYKEDGSINRDAFIRFMEDQWSLQ